MCYVPKYNASRDLLEESYTPSTLQSYTFNFLGIDIKSSLGWFENTASRRTPNRVDPNQLHFLSLYYHRISVDPHRVCFCMPTTRSSSDAPKMLVREHDILFQFFGALFREECHSFTRPSTWLFERVKKLVKCAMNRLLY